MTTTSTSIVSRADMCLVDSGMCLVLHNPYSYAGKPRRTVNEVTPRDWSTYFNSRGTSDGRLLGFEVGLRIIWPPSFHCEKKAGTIPISGCFRSCSSDWLLRRVNAEANSTVRSGLLHGHIST